MNRLLADFTENGLF